MFLNSWRQDREVNRPVSKVNKIKREKCVCIMVIFTELSPRLDTDLFPLAKKLLVY